jgi:hypothetical protein
MKRRLLAAAAFWALTLGVYAQTPLAPPTALPTAFPSVTPVPLEPSATLTPSFTTSISETASPTETVDPLVTNDPLEMAVAADVLFPAGVAFQVVFRGPETGLRSITMTAEQEGWAGQTIDIDPSEVDIDENGLSVLSYLWSVGENPPRLFEPLTITWSITPRGGASEVVETEIAFADSRVTWVVAETSGIPTRFAVSDTRTTVAVISAQLSSLSDLLGAGGREIPPLNVVLFPSGVNIDPCVSGDSLVGPLTAIEALCDSESATSLYAEQGWDVAAVTITAPVREIVVDSVVRAAYPVIFDSEDVPDWFKTGVISYLAGSFNANELDVARSASRSNSLLSELDIVPSDAKANQWRVQSIGTVVYMASQIGVVPMLEMLSRIDDGELLSDVWLDQSGQTLSAINVSWRNWIFSPRAEAAYSSLPSLAPTLTLVPTRTATFTPTPTSTLTPSATWTNTLIPSLTPTMTPSVASGFEQPTAAPTHTPTATLRPTITPRPAVAFSLEDAPEEPSSPLDRSLTIIAAVAVVVVVVSAVFLLFTRRRK